MKKSPLIRVAGILALGFPGISMAQNLFEADSVSGTIYEFTPGGVRSTFASVTSATGLAFNSAGNLFVTDPTHDNIDEFTPGGTESTFASGVQNPCGLAFDSAGNLFVADQIGGNIDEFTPGGAESTFATGLQAPNGLAFDSTGNLFVACQATGDANGSIVKITPGGVKSVFVYGLYPLGLVFNSAGILFESDSFGIFEYTPGGVQSTLIGTSGLGRSALPYGMTFDGAGNLLVSVQLVNTHPTNDNIDRVTPGGVESTFASGLDYPTYLAFQPVPEPSVWLMLGTSVLTLLGFRRKSV
ncbi:MAG: NHL repeat-containing protein [Verrucomicrobiota bacterium]|jgi:hypothetical protein